jgi:hypothetical protein
VGGWRADLIVTARRSLGGAARSSRSGCGADTAAAGPSDSVIGRDIQHDSVAKRRFSTFSTFSDF